MTCNQSGKLQAVPQFQVLKVKSALKVALWGSHTLSFIGSSVSDITAGVSALDYQYIT